MNRDTTNTREAQRRYRSRQKAKLEDFRQRVELLNRKLRDLDVKNAGLASQNKILEEAAAAVQAKHQKAAEEADEQAQTVWDPRTGKAWADYANCVRPGCTLVDLSPEEGRKLQISDIQLLCKDFYEQIAIAVATPMPTEETNRTIARLLAAKRAFRDALEFMGAKASTHLISVLLSTLKYNQPTIHMVKEGVEMLQLSEEQKADLLSARRRLLKKHIDIQEERVGIVRRMHDTMDRGRQGDDQHNMSFLLEEVEALEELKRNLEREHVSTYNFHSTFGDTLSQFQYAKVLAYNQTHHVKPWPIVQMLAAQDAEQRFDYNTEEASIDDLFATVDFGSQGVHNPVREAGLAAVKEEPAGLKDARANASAEEKGLEPSRAGDSLRASSKPLATEPQQAPNSAADGGAAAQTDKTSIPFTTDSPPSHNRSTSTTMSGAGSLEDILEGNFADDVLSDPLDPLDLDFGQPSSNSAEQNLWQLVQNFSTTNRVGV